MELAGAITFDSKGAEPRADRHSGVYADPTKVRAVQHHGKQYRVDAVHLSEPSPQRTPVLYQAGSSPRGRRFAASHAECVFLNGQGVAGVKAIIDDIRAQASAAGRSPADIKAFLGVTVVTGATEAEARDKFDDYRQYVSSEAALVHAAASLGVDLARFDLDEPVDTSASQAITSNAEAMARSHGPQWTRRKLLEQMVLGSRQAPLVGAAGAVAEALIRWTEDAGVDGFNLSRTVAPECSGCRFHGRMCCTLPGCRGGRCRSFSSSQRASRARTLPSSSRRSSRPFSAAPD